MNKMPESEVDGPKLRVVYINDHQQATFCKNEISTAKYSVWTFFPKFLYEQFRRYANIFFLVIALLQQIPGVSPTGRFTTLVPLIIIMTISAIKEMIEDVKRHYADDATNKSKTLVLFEGKWVETMWKDLQVGNLVKIRNNEEIPADLVLLASSEPQAMCYIETSNLDGETSLKLRQGLSQTADLLTAESLGAFRGWVECELPNRRLEEFVGVLRAPNGMRYPLEPSQLLLRGASLKNTNWVFGLVIYTGKESKIMLNSTAAPLKQSSVERQTNTYILSLFGLLLFLTLFTFFANLIWTWWTEPKMWYLYGTAGDATALRIMLDLTTCLILYNTVIPISLPVMLEVVRFIQALYINWDLDMYDSDTDTPAMARTSNLNEELGKVRYLFSDKTGTLTRNVMEFKRCSIGGVIYGNEMEDSNALEDRDLLARLKAEDPLVKEFFMTLALCHTVIPDAHLESPGSPLTYQASSPDEAALVNAARSLGFVFTTRTPSGVSVTVNGVEFHYEVLQVLEFTSLRKRMGVVVREPGGRILILVKGADSVIFDRLEPTSQYREATLLHLKMFANTGLRTLCFASAEVSSEFHARWAEDYYLASTSLNNREAKLEQVAEAIEMNLRLLGATAIEDKLQEGVPETIANLIQAGIAVWILTGDMQETAINIGYSCHLLTPGMHHFIVNTESLDDTRMKLNDIVSSMGLPFTMKRDFALIIDGRSLEYALHCECQEDFIRIALSCHSVICCRVSPWQKAQLVKLIRAFEKNAVTLAIGDGANDVGMIQAAHVGVGISGMEGRQAVCASDYAIAQFRFLNKLLLVHGAWNYNRLTKLILYSFYKNVCLYLIQFWFAMYSGFSGQIIFERWSIGMYNVLFSAAPPLALGLFDRNNSVENCLNYPVLYKYTRDSNSFNLKVFLCWILNAVFHSAILFWVPLAAFNSTSLYLNGHSGSLLVVGNSIYTYVVVTVCIKAGLKHTTWTWLSHLAIWGSVAMWFLFLLINSHVYPTLPMASDMVGMDTAVYGCSVFWIGLLLIPPLCLTPDVAWEIAKRKFGASVREKIEQVDVEPGQVIKYKLKSRSTDRSGLMHVTRHPRGLKPFPHPCSEASAERLRTLSGPRTVDHGFAYSQEVHGAVGQSDLIRVCDSTRRKPEGR